MPTYFPCPNAQCSYQFDADILPPAAMVTCPLCRTRFPYRANRPVPTAAGPAGETVEDRPSGPPQKTRSAVLARHGIACTSQPLATEAALAVLRAGGNAIDAAIAANAVLGVVEPMSCSLGGDLFALVWDARTQTLYGLNASGRAPKAATIERFRDMGLDFVPNEGPLSWSVPGCVDGWEMLRERFGSKPSRTWPRIAIA